MIQDVVIRTTPRLAAELAGGIGNASAGALAVVAEAARLRPAEIRDLRIVRRSIDARQRRVMVNLTVRIATGDDAEVKSQHIPMEFQNVSETAPRVIIVGAGPAGLFAALKALQLGIRPIVLERGADVDSRRIDLANISRNDVVDPESNYSFGEGGAGAYSDGKLYTRSKKRGNVREVLDLFVQHGASEDILIDAHPHIGTDRLPVIIRNMRETILSHGGEVHFHTRVDSLIVEDGAVKGVITAKGERFEGPVILATGHSARDVYRMLDASGMDIEAKGIAMGCRLEHPQELIDTIQYHSPEGRGKWLPAAEYSFVTQADGRGVYSFCMCPGGVIVPAASAPDQQVVNGMSSSARGSRWANSGMVVEIHPGDFPEYDKYGKLSMMHLQEDLERKFYQASDRSLNAPAQRMTDFVNRRKSSSLPRSSYAPGVHPADFNTLFPPFIADRLRKGFTDFGRKSRGFLTDKAILVGLESRTSSPVRINRDPVTLEHTVARGLYPAGEGAGFAGGIVSAAIDGIRCVESLNNALKQNDI